MSDDRLNKVRERKDKLPKEMTDKLSKDYNELIAKSMEKIGSLRQGSKDFYTHKAEEELDKCEQDMKSGNTISAISRKMMAETYFALTRSL
jgi:hypothetical protein